MRRRDAGCPKFFILPAAKRRPTFLARETGVYRNGLVHVMAHLCSTCIFRPGNLMRLNPGRVEEMVDNCRENEGVIPCHKTTYGQEPGEAVCRGFFLKHATAPLQVAERMGVIALQELTHPRTASRSLAQVLPAGKTPQAKV